MRFKQITLIDRCGLVEKEMMRLAAYSENKLCVYDTDPADDEEVLRRIGSSDCILTSWRTKVNAGVLEQASSLKYVGMCCSLYDEDSANVDIATAKKQGIAVKGVRDYGDYGTVEFVFSTLISLFKGYGQYQWRELPQELHGKSIGIVGMGTLGTMVASLAQQFGMEVSYFSRSRKLDLERKGVSYSPIEELVAECDIVTTHLPRNAKPLTPEVMAKKKINSVLINTSIGPTFNENAFFDWLRRDDKSFAVFDREGAGKLAESLEKTDRVLMYPGSSGFTAEAMQRLSEKVILNIQEYLNTRTKYD